MEIVWFKRDLRAADHRPLAAAARLGPVLPLYITEPELWRQPDMAARHWAFITECLHELNDALAALGQPLQVRRGDAVTVLDQLTGVWPIERLWSHEETGNDWTYQRDLQVAAWCRLRGIEWREIPQHGVIRRLSSRNGWAKRWDKFMAEPITEAPSLAPIDGLDQPVLAPPDAQELGLAFDGCEQRQLGGRSHGLERLTSFLASRGRHYRTAMSSPLAGEDACSRLSPHLAWGSLAMREVAQATALRRAELRGLPPADAKDFGAALNSFNGRLHWHCHFIQKLEDEPSIELRNLHRAYDGMRDAQAPGAASRLNAWARGETGLPFVDACMRSLIATGWLNFRMRAMLMATASYHLWLDWREPGLHLARLFIDYEPGIHWPQTQMQSGTTGINTVRIYNPVKQGYDQDPKGIFVRRWLPELAGIADDFIHEPWRAPNAAVVLGKLYPEPVVDHLAAAKQAREAIWAVRKSAAFKDTANAIQSKHGSRKSGIPMTGQNRARRRKAKQTDSRQLTFDLGSDR